VPGITVSYDMQQRRLLVADGFGQRIVEPLLLEPSAAMPWLNQMSPIEPSVVGRTLVVRTAAGVSGYDLGAAAGESRLLWKTAGRSAPGRDLVSVRAVASGRVARHGGVPLGRRITEPDDLDGPRGTVAPAARRTGVLVPSGRTVSLLEPTTGRVLWERQGLPGIVEWIADDDSACGCTVDGLSSPVLSMCDGRLLHVVDLPGRRIGAAAFVLYRVNAPSASCQPAGATAGAAAGGAAAGQLCLAAPGRPAQRAARGSAPGQPAGAGAAAAIPG
jgi:hypothetical protein